MSPRNPAIVVEECSIMQFWYFLRHLLVILSFDALTSKALA